MTGLEKRSEAKRRLLEKFLRGEVARQNWEVPIEPHAPGISAPLAPGQYLIWLSSQMTAADPIYNAPITIHRRGPLDRETLQRTFDEFVRRHEILRTTFTSVEGEVVQAVHQQLRISIPFVDLSMLPPEAREQEAKRLAEADACRPFDTAMGPLCRMRLVQLEPEYHRLYLTVHHLIFDGVSIYNVLLPEVSAIYEAFAAGKPSPLPEPRYQYSDFALWQKRMLDNDSVTRQINFWRGELAGELPDLRLAADRPHPSMHSYRGASKTFALPAELTGAVRAAAGREGVSQYMFFLAAFKTLLHGYSQQEDIMIGGVSGARRRPEFQKLMGNFSNFLVLRTKPAAQATFREYLTQVKDTVLGALANGDVPIDQVIREVDPSRKCAWKPFFQVIFSMEPLAAEVPSQDWHITQMDIDTGFTKFELYFEIDERVDGLFARFVYSTELFNPWTIERMTSDWLKLLEAVAANPSARLCDLAVSSLPCVASSPDSSQMDKTVGSPAPRNEIERKLAAIWQSVLNTGPIGREDNFFDLGGHSFQVAKLLRKIEVEFGSRLSMSAMFEAPTISRLAELLGGASSIARLSQTSTLQSAGTLEPLFWVYGGPLVRPLANSLGANRPFLGVDLDRDMDGLSDATFSEFAARLMRTIRERQPHGPYFVGGWCISGLLAYEVASQLLGAGEEVGLVVMLDAPNPSHYFRISKFHMLGSKAVYHAKRLLRTELREIVSFTRMRMKGFLTQLSADDSELENPFQRALHRAVRTYRPRPLGARVLAVQPLERPGFWNLRESWATHIAQGSLEVRDVPGDHETMLAEPNVTAVASAIWENLPDKVAPIRRVATG